jgi:hypothetical protein
MQVRSVATVLLSLILVPVSTPAQQPSPQAPQRDPNAVLLLSKSLALMHRPS